MPVEIERKFLVQIDRLPALRPDEASTFEQGYLSISPSVRVRLSLRAGVERAWLTVKGAGLVSRDEFEYEIPPADARAMAPLCSARLAKRRYAVHVGAHTWDLDEFTGSHAGLWLAEVELDDANEVFEHPPWLAHEVTSDKRYANSALALAGRAP